MNHRYNTREEWLEGARRLLGDHITDCTGMEVPPLMVSPGWPSKGGPEGRVLGECWHAVMTETGIAHIFLSPLFDDAEAIRLLDVLLHEMLHAVCNTHYDKQCEHGKEFTKAARDCGLEGKPTSTYASEGSQLWNKLATFHTKLGVYPGAAIQMEAGAMRAAKRGMKPGAKIDQPKKKRASGHWVKFESKTLEGYIVRVSPVALREHGAPLDPKGDKMRCVDKKYKENGELK